MKLETEVDQHVSTSHDVVLRARNVTVEYGGEMPTRAVRNVSIDLRRGEILGIAGESGCGKSTLAFALTRLLRPPATMVGGTVEFLPSSGGAPIDLMALGPRELRAFRWSKISMVFQAAMNSLNPVTSLRRQFSDMFLAHDPSMTSDECEQRSCELLEMVGIKSERLNGFAFELSGGMRQRVGIAMALALRPEVVIMDEPTTALDVVVQRDILEEIFGIREQLGFSIIFITHDLPMLVEVSDRLAIMYAGEIVETAPSTLIGDDPAHPYTMGLQNSCPDLRGERAPLVGIPGSPPDLRFRIKGCSFAPRCAFAFAPCHEVHPLLTTPMGSVRGVVDAGNPSLVKIRPSSVDRLAVDEWRVACHLHDALPSEAEMSHDSEEVAVTGVERS